MQLCGHRDSVKYVGRAVLGRRLALLGPWDSVRLRTASTCWSVPGKYGPHGELFFFLIKKEPVVASDVSSNSFVPAETLKACALIGLQFLAEEAGSHGSESPDLGDMWRHC